jgi:LacI family transcriptional regulator
MKDIARDLGISPMAVSKALRNHDDISKETRERVMRRAAELNYRLDWIARSMVTGRTYLVGLVLPDLMQSFFAEVAMGVTRRLAPAGYQVVILHTQEDPREEAASIDLLVTRKVDGLIIASAQRGGGAQTLRELKTPYVLIDRAIQGLKANYVGVQNEELGFVATKHLAEQGCRRIAHLRGPALSTSQGRLKGYKRALAEHKLKDDPGLVVEGGYTDASGYEAMRALLKKSPRPDGVFCFNDPVAVGAIRAIQEAGLRVPEDVAVIGAANMHYSDMIRVPLSSVDQSSAEIGERASDLLLECMTAAEAPPAKRILVKPRLVVRESSRRRG